MPRRYRRFIPRPHIYTRAPGCGCIGCSAPLLLAVAGVVAAVVVWLF
jgi:hypothetical protein